MPDRTLTICNECAAPLDVDADAVAWLGATARDLGLRYLLAHADDGVIWGLRDSDAFATPYPAVGAQLRTVTLQEARLFDERGEVLLWRDGVDRFRARVIRPVQESEVPTWSQAFEELHLLWGDQPDPNVDNPAEVFTPLREGAQGLRHAPPMPGLTVEALPLALRVRHYVTFAPALDEKATGAGTSPGLARIAASRLLGFAPTS
ncbi:MAG: CRISPR-associated protein Csx19 [Pseudomonadota bacterium]